MKTIKIPLKYNYIGVFLTFRCNLSCFYCLNKVSKNFIDKRKELTSEQWIQTLNRLESSTDIPITLEGGEPSLHSGFYNIIEGINYPIDILTNLNFSAGEFIYRVDENKLNKGRKSSYKSIRISYHNQNMDELINKAKILQDYGFKIGIFSINLPENTENNMIMAEKCRQNKIYYFIKDFLGYKNGRLFGHYKYSDAVNGIKKFANCRIRELLIAPDGKVFRCHRDLYADENPIGNILDEDFVINDIFRSCTNYGTCHYCDIKLKTNRYLEMGSCSVEIER